MGIIFSFSFLFFIIRCWVKGKERKGKLPKTWKKTCIFKKWNNNKIDKWNMVKSEQSKQIILLCGSQITYNLSIIYHCYIINKGNLKSSFSIIEAQLNCSHGEFFFFFFKLYNNKTVAPWSIGRHDHRGCHHEQHFAGCFLCAVFVFTAFWHYL